jgi:hypothetical protein
LIPFQQEQVSDRRNLFLLTTLAQRERHVNRVKTVFLGEKDCILKEAVPYDGKVGKWNAGMWQWKDEMVE